MSRILRTETRSRHNEIKRTMHSHEKVRKWEKKWVTIEDTTMQIFKWVPIRIDEQTKQQQESQLQLDGSNQNGNNQYKSNDESQEISEVKTPTIPMNNSDETKHNDDDERRQQQQQQQTIAERLAAGCGDDQDKKSSDPTQVMTNGNKENNLSLIGGSSTTTTTMAEIPSSTLQTLEKSHVTPVISQSASEIKSSGPGSSQADDGIVFEELAQVKRPSVDQQKVISTEIEQQVQSGPVVGTSSGSITLSSDAKVLEPTVKPVQSGPAEIAEKRQHEDVDKDLSRVEPPMKQIKVTDKPVSESRADLEEKEESKKQVKASMVDDETATNSTVTKTTTTITTTAAAPDAEQKVSEERADDKSDDYSGKESEEKPMDTSMAEP